MGSKNMLRINLLAEESQRKIKIQRMFFLLLEAEIILFLLILAAGLIFLAAEKILSETHSQFERDISRQIQSSGADYNLKVRDINGRMAVVAQIQAGFASYSRYLKNIAALLPPGVFLSSVNIDSGAKAIVIRGVAQSRNDLLALEKNLQEAAWLTKVNVRLEDKLKKTNIEFGNIDLEFDPAKMP
jgi:Tfp pilus assembly protein PilN